VTDARRKGKVNDMRVKHAIRDLLIGLGYDPIDPALEGTPGRVARAWAELLDADPGTTDTAFASPAVDELVVLRGITGWSMCEHHLLPFSYRATVAYLPAVDDDASRLLGLSKLARLVRAAGASLQLQERMTAQVADGIEAATKARGVAVRITGVHLCAVMRGVRASDAEFVTTVVRGSIREDAAQRAEFLSAAG
jgi:GTP cyclohydrolase I